MDGWTEFPPVFYRTLSPIGSAAQKGKEKRERSKRKKESMQIDREIEKRKKA